MSDTYYRERAARRARIFWMVGGIIFIFACLTFTTYRIFWDECTQSFARDPQAIVLKYVEAIASGNAEQPRRCWIDEKYFDLETGCSEICIQRILNTPYAVQNVQISSPTITTEGRALRTATVSIVCGDSGQTYSGDIILDSIRQNVPWQHWKIIYSEFGGQLSKPWCK
jgi:hypothetical protein